MAGDRDSEVAVVIDDEDLVSSKMASQPYIPLTKQVRNNSDLFDWYNGRKDGVNLRTALWREHLGVTDVDALSIMVSISTKYILVVIN